MKGGLRDLNGRRVSQKTNDSTGNRAGTIGPNEQGKYGRHAARPTSRGKPNCILLRGCTKRRTMQQRERWLAKRTSRMTAGNLEIYSGGSGIRNSESRTKVFRPGCSSMTTKTGIEPKPKPMQNLRTEDDQYTKKRETRERQH